MTIPYYPLSADMLADRAPAARPHRQAHPRQPRRRFVYDDPVVEHIVSQCNDPDSGGRMIDNIITNTLLPALSREFLKRSMAKEEPKEAKVSIENGEFTYGWA